MKKFFYCLCMAVMILAACKKTDEVFVNASFTTDKDTYEVFENVVITNTTVVSNASIATCKWELGEGRVSYDYVPEELYYERPGEYIIKLTVTSDAGSVKGTYEKKIMVEDNNIKPVVDFSWSPERVVAGEPVRFTDASTDEDGTIEEWEWTFGTTVVKEQNPEFTFAEYGPVDVSLKVTDNDRGTAVKTVTIEVAKGASFLDLMWAHSYDDVADAYVYGTSPAVSPDGKYIYVSSSGYHLVCFDADGNRKWDYDISQEGASAMNNNGNIRSQTPTPSVDEDGTVFIPASFDEPKTAQGGVFAITGGESGGTRKWYTSYGATVSFRYLSPVITEKYIITVQRNTGAINGTANSNNFIVLDKTDGGYVTNAHANSGSYGGILALKNGMVVAGTGGNHGSRLFFPDGEGKWKFSRSDASDKGHNLGVEDESGATSACNEPKGSQPAADKDGRIYQLFCSGTNRAAQSLSVLFCYDSRKLQYGIAPVPDYVCPINGATTQTGLGVVLGEDGTAYVTTAVSGETSARVTAVSSSGTVLWESIADGNINGVAAVDNLGYIYYNDYTTGKLVKLSPADGRRSAEITLGEELRSSPTIAADGTIYVTGMKDGKPTLFAISGSADGHADSWSQLGGNPSKTEYMY